MHVREFTGEVIGSKLGPSLYDWSKTLDACIRTVVDHKDGNHSAIRLIRLSTLVRQNAMRSKLGKAASLNY